MLRNSSVAPIARGRHAPRPAQWAATSGRQEMSAAACRQLEYRDRIEQDADREPHASPEAPHGEKAGAALGPFYEPVAARDLLPGPQPNLQGREEGKDRDNQGAQIERE